MKGRKMDFWFFLNNKGFADGGDGGDGGNKGGDGGDGKTFTQTQLDHIVGERLARERDNYKDYADLQKFRADHEKQATEAEQKALEEKAEYEKLKENYEKQIADLSGKVTEKDRLIVDKDVNFALSNEIGKQGGFVEECIALLKGKATYKDGAISIAYVDDNNVSQSATVEEGVKKFLEKRPHLKKATQDGGGGTGAGTGNDAGTGGAGGAGDGDLASLNNQLLQARNIRDMKKAGEIEGKIRDLLKVKGIQL